MESETFEHQGEIYEIEPREFEQLEIFRCRVEYITQKLPKYENVTDELYHKIVIKSYRVANEKVLGCKY